MDVVNLKKEKGFTLVELLVVIAIIGVLATLLLLQLGGTRAKARDTKRISDLSQVKTAMELYFDDCNGTYPGSSLYSADSVCKGGTEWPLDDYLGTGKTPTDPLDQAQYGYATAPTVGGKIIRYQTWAELEAGNPALRTDDDINATGWTARSTGRMASAVNGSSATTEPSSGTSCADQDTTNANCVFDQGVR